jgi:hypothetical protein
MRNIIVINGVLSAALAGNTSDVVSVQSIVEEANTSHKYVYPMRVESRKGVHRIVFGDDMYNDRNDLKSVHTSRAHLGIYDALCDAGIPKEQLTFSNMRKDGRGGFKPSTCIFLNPPADARPGTAAAAGPVAMDDLVTEYFSLSGDIDEFSKFSDRKLPEAAQRGWLTARINALKPSTGIDFAAAAAKSRENASTVVADPATETEPGAEEV